jgi:hypothetical protein
MKQSRLNCGGCIVKVKLMEIITKNIRLEASRTFSRKQRKKFEDKINAHGREINDEIIVVP